MEKTIKIVKQHKIIAIMRGVAEDKVVSAAKALYEGGIRLIEVTFNQAKENGVIETSSAIKTLCSEFGDDMLIGAGTVMNCEQLEAAIDAGAKYIISPNSNTEIIRNTVKFGAVSMPGAFTPTEIAMAYDAGASFIKVFPAGQLGPGYIKAIKGPINHIPLLAVGGIDETNMIDYFKAGVVGIGVGSNIVNNKLIDDNKFDELMNLAKKYIQQL